MAIETIVDVSLHPGQRTVWEHPARFRVLAAGRRWGKTWLGCALCFDTALRGGRAWWVAPSYPMSNVGWRGLNELRMQLLPLLKIEQRLSERSLSFPGGGEVRVKSADNPDGLRGEGLNLAVLDECAYMREAAWTEAIRPSLSDRKGKALFISTPRGHNWFRELWARGQVAKQNEYHSWTFRTRDNPFIDAAEIEAARLSLSSRVFRQEYEADFMDDSPGALWKRAWIDDGRVIAAPKLRRIVVGVDPSASTTGDACGIVAVGEDGTHFYILEDATVQGSPETWARSVVTLYHKLKADAIIAEANQGGEMVTAVIGQVQRNLPVQLVHATRGKAVRAEPVSTIYEQGRAHHVGHFMELENELCQWEAGSGSSPNRLDALVWAVTELVGRGRRGGRGT